MDVVRRTEGMVIAVGRNRYIVRKKEERVILLLGRKEWFYIYDKNMNQFIFRMKERTVTS